MSRSINRFGDRYQFVKEEINAINQLKPGDHIAFESKGLYWHHMIIEKVEKEQEKIHVIHYHNSCERFIYETFPEKAIVREDTFNFNDERYM
jgi:hypothetical protein